MNWLKKFIILILLILVIQLINEIEKKTSGRDHSNKYITTQEFKLKAENFAARSAEANLASKKDIDDFMKKIDFDDKLKN